jgi:hypothetical protein
VDVAPRLVAAVPKKTVGKCTVLEALTENRWISDIHGAITVGVIAEYLILWDILSTVELQMGVSDTHYWRLDKQTMLCKRGVWGFLLGVGSVWAFWENLEVLGTS